MHKTLLICLASLTLVLNAAAAAFQGTPNYQSAEELQREVTLLLLDKNIDEITKQLDSETPSTVASLFRRLAIYGRAGQTSRVRKTLEQFPSVENWRCQVGYDLKQLIRNADKSLDARRLYYEQICPNDTDGAEEFVKLWQSDGDPKELDKWLGDRSNRNDEWLMQRVMLRARSGAAGELLDALAAEVRANPTDWDRLDRYLKANSYIAERQDVGWIADTFEVHTATEHFELAERVRSLSPQAGVKLLQKSLALPFTDTDAKQLEKLMNRYRSVALSIKVNWEKQLRYSTKRSLAQAYQQMNQSLAAQPLVEELVAIKDTDILLEDIHQLAGTVQSGSGQRVVETKILRDETERRSTSEYWLERAGYYSGRNEYERERDSYRQALVALTAKREDTRALIARYQVVSAFAFFLGEGHSAREDKAELEALLTRELNSLPPETDYAFQIAELITQNELELDELRNSLLAKRPLYLTRLLDGRREWTNTEQGLIENVVHREEVRSELKEKLWSSLESLVREPGSTRAYFLAEAMEGSDELQRAIPLLRGYIEHASPNNWEGYKPGAVSDLFAAYCRIKQWQAAEKLLFAHQDVFSHALPKALAQVAVVAAQQNAINDAMRLWRMSTNLDRRNIETLPEIARTNARPQLLAMYRQMKKDDPVSTIPDLALRLLQ